jgi:hypothetical protein
MGAEWDEGAEGDTAHVLIQKTHRGWLVFFILAVVAGYAAYWYDAHNGRAALFGHSGGSAIGLTLGIVAATLLIFAALRPVRRWIPAAGSPGVWARAHFWLGALVLPLAWFHGGFHHGGALTSASMWLLYLVFASGLLAAMLRYFVTSGNDEPIEEAVKRLAAEAEDAVIPCGPIEGGDVELWRAERVRQLQSRVELTGGAHPREEVMAELAAAPVARSEPLRELYSLSVKPYLENPGGEGVLADSVKSGQVMRRYRHLLPEELHPRVERLGRICEDYRTLRLREKIQRRVDAWMIAHVPLTVALVIVVVVHGVYALRY